MINTNIRHGITELGFRFSPFSSCTELCFPLFLLFSCTQLGFLLFLLLSFFPFPCCLTSFFISAVSFLVFSSFFQNTSHSSYFISILYFPFRHFFFSHLFTGFLFFFSPLSLHFLFICHVIFYLSFFSYTLLSFFFYSHKEQS